MPLLIMPPDRCQFAASLQRALGMQEALETQKEEFARKEEVGTAIHKHASGVLAHPGP